MDVVGLIAQMDKATLGVRLGQGLSCENLVGDFITYRCQMAQRFGLGLEV